MGDGGRSLEPADPFGALSSTLGSADFGDEKRWRRGIRRRTFRNARPTSAASASAPIFRRIDRRARSGLNFAMSGSRQTTSFA